MERPGSSPRPTIPGVPNRSQILRIVVLVAVALVVLFALSFAAAVVYVS